MPALVLTNANFLDIQVKFIPTFYLNVLKIKILEQYCVRSITC